jgi:hypothetical protein
MSNSINNTRVCIYVGELGGYGDIVMTMKILNYLKTRVRIRVCCYKRSAELKCRSIIPDFEDYFIDKSDCETEEFDVTFMVAVPVLLLSISPPVRSKRYVFITEYNDILLHNCHCGTLFSVLRTGFEKRSVTLSMKEHIVSIECEAPPFIPDNLYHFAYNSVVDSSGERADSRYNSYFWLNRYLLFMERLYSLRNEKCTVLLYGNNDPNRVLKDVIDEEHNLVSFKDASIETTIDFYPDGYAIMVYGNLRIVMCHIAVSHKRMTDLMFNSQEPLFVTGDQTLTEVLSIGKMFMYQQYSWKYKLVECFIENITESLTDANTDATDASYTIVQFFKSSMKREDHCKIDELVDLYNSINRTPYIEYCEGLHTDNTFYTKLMEYV